MGARAGEVQSDSRRGMGVSVLGVRQPQCQMDCMEGSNVRL